MDKIVMGLLLVVVVSMLDTRGGYGMQVTRMGTIVAKSPLLLNFAKTKLGMFAIIGVVSAGSVGLGWYFTHERNETGMLLDKSKNLIIDSKNDMGELKKQGLKNSETSDEVCGITNRVREKVEFIHQGADTTFKNIGTTLRKIDEDEKKSHESFEKKLQQLKRFDQKRQGLLERLLRKLKVW
jgi:hypothetical protein